MKILLTFLSLLFVPFLGIGQKGTINSQYKNEIDLLTIEGQKIINSTLFQDRKQANELFKETLKALLMEDDSIVLDLSRVSNLMSVNTIDSSFRILTWALLDANNSYNYFGFVQHASDEYDYQLIELDDKSDIIENPEKQPLTANNWYGCLYYDLISINNGLRDIITLVGWDGNNSMSHRKIIENLYFDKDTIGFGLPIIRDNKNTYLYRKIFEFSGELKMTLDIQNNPSKRIVYDHLTPSNPSLKGVYEYYGPDLSFDAYEWGERYWDYVSDIDIDQHLSKKSKDFEVKDRDTIQSKNLFTPYKDQ